MDFHFIVAWRAIVGYVIAAPVGVGEVWKRIRDLSIDQFLDL